MTVAIIDQGPTPFSIAALQGFRIDRVNGKKHYVAVDKRNRAVVGPVAKRRRPLFYRANPQSLPGSRLMTDEDKVLAETPFEAVRKAFSGVLPPAPPPQKRSAWSRLKEKVAGVKDAAVWRFYDTDWHKNVQHLAMDVIVWALAVATVSFVVKAVLWTWL